MHDKIKQLTLTPLSKVRGSFPYSITAECMLSNLDTLVNELESDKNFGLATINIVCRSHFQVKKNKKGKRICELYDKNG